MLVTAIMPSSNLFSSCGRPNNDPFVGEVGREANVSRSINMPGRSISRSNATRTGNEVEAELKAHEPGEVPALHRNSAYERKITIACENGLGIEN